jgi:hypothetical protein
VHARSLRSLEASASAAVATGAESLTFNPRRGTQSIALDRETELLNRGRVLTRRIIGMSRAFRDHYDANLYNEPTVLEIARELSRAAHDLVLLADQNDAAASSGRGDSRSTVPEAPPEDLLPALTAPLMIPRPHPQHWVLIGSLMEDMRRVREEITGEADE